MHQYRKRTPDRTHPSRHDQGDGNHRQKRMDHGVGDAVTAADTAGIQLRAPNESGNVSDQIDVEEEASIDAPIDLRLVNHDESDADDEIPTYPQRMFNLFGL